LPKYFTIIKCILCVNLFILLSCRKDVTGIEQKVCFNTWEISAPDEQGLDSSDLQNAFDEADRVGFMDCLLIIKNGYLVGEEYYNGYDECAAHDVKSVSKSFLSALTGIALREGYIENLDEKMLNYFPEYNNPGLDARKQDITLQHLLTMRMGLQHEYNNYLQLYNTSNWIESTIEFPLTYDPGSTFSYNTFQTHLLSAILTKSSGMSTLALADTFLFEPMNISIDHWQQGPSGYYFGGNSMHFTPRDMAVLGYLYLQNGYINNKQIIPADWVEKSLTNSTGFIDKDWGDLKNYNYGCLWWLGAINDYELFLAIGYGGQFVIVVPELNLIIVTTANANIDWDTADSQERSILNIVASFII